MFWTYHLYFSVVIILVSLYDKKIFHARIRIRRNDYKTFYLNSKEVKFSLFGGLLSHTCTGITIEKCEYANTNAWNVLYR